MIGGLLFLQKQFKPPDFRKAANQSKRGLSEAEAEAEVEGVKEEVERDEGQNGELDIEERHVTYFNCFCSIFSFIPEG